MCKPSRYSREQLLLDREHLIKRLEDGTVEEWIDDYLCNVTIREETRVQFRLWLTEIERKLSELNNKKN